MKAKDFSAIPADALSAAQAKAELKRLAAEIAGHDKRYYQDDAPAVSDADYDALRQRNAAIEARFPDLVRGDSPSRRIGAAPWATATPSTTSTWNRLSPAARPSG